jgi:hypothetical protein
MLRYIIIIIMQMIILIAPNYIGRDNTKVTIPRLLVGYENEHNTGDQNSPVC